MFFSFLSLHAQKSATVYGIVTDYSGKKLQNVNITVEGDPTLGSISNGKGEYEIALPSGTNIILTYSHVALQSEYRSVQLAAGQKLELNVKLKDVVMRQVDIIDDRRRGSSQSRLSTRGASELPSSSLTGVAAMIVTQSVGVSSSSELSSQYSVRGGNFDENLVVVNHTTIQRPFLVRSGQQEGLSFVNPDLVSSLEFSSGGFDAKYDDKISSVLDITYKRPLKTEGSLSASLMGGTFYVGGRDSSQKFSHCSGFRYKNPTVILKTLTDTVGAYRPSFVDFQSYMTYLVNSRLSFDALLYTAQNRYYFQPVSNEINQGGAGAQTTYRTTFEGSELDRFENYLITATAKYKLKDNLHLSLTADYFYSDETESYDLLTDYILGEAFEETFTNTFAVGKFREHARNKFKSELYSASLYGKYFILNNKTEWGAKLKKENIDFSIEEWTMMDSADYSIPHNEDKLEMYHSARGSYTQQSEELSAFVQHTLKHELAGGQRLSLTGGVRGSYKNLNHELLVSPRFRVSFDPSWKRDVVFRFASGLYQQPPSMREFIKPDGSFASGVKAQKTVHYVLGADYNLKIWKRPFKFVAELYYKDLRRIIPYVVDNVMIQYFPDQTARGYTTGIDLKLNGEFIPGTESWASLSFLNSKEKIEGDPAGYTPRPSDQLVNLGLFFQDYMPSMETFRVNIAFYYGSSLPVWFPGDKKQGDPIAKIKSYKRADVGLLKEFSFKNSFIDQFWVGLEIFNLFNEENEISYSWIKDVRGGSYGIPNNLTSLILNVKIEVKF